MKSIAEKDFLSKLRNSYFFSVINANLFMQYENVKQKLERANACFCSLKITEVEDVRLAGEGPVPEAAVRPKKCLCRAGVLLLCSVFR